MSEDEDGVVHINMPQGSGKPLMLDLGSTLCVHCNSLKALAILKKIVVHCNYCKVFIKDNCDFGSSVVDVTDYNIDDFRVFPDGIISKSSPAKLVTFKTKQGNVRLS